MPTTDELRAYDVADFGHVVLIDGIMIGFGDREEMLAYTPGGHSIRAGLVKAGTSFTESGNLRTGQLNDDTFQLTIDDHYGDLARLFAGVDDGERSLGDVPLGTGTRVHPNDSLAARPELDSMNIGIERIGPNGERHQYPAPTDYQIGLDHSIAVPGMDLAGAPVSENPIVWAGRRVVVYRCYRDRITYPHPSASGWRDFDEAVVVHWGTIRDEGEIQGRRWKFDCDGPSSWLRKPLGLGIQQLDPERPIRVQGVISLSTTAGADETGMASRLELIGANGVIAAYGARNFTAAITGTTADEIRDEIAAELGAVAAAAGTDGVWEDQAGYSLAMVGDGSIRISVDSQVGVAVPPGAGAGVLNLCLHRKVWGLLGYDVDYQRTLDAEPDEQRAISFSPIGLNGSFSQANDLGPDYWVGYFPTGRIEWPGGDVALSNNGVMRQYQPLHLQGTTILLAGLNAGQGQVIRLGDAVLGGGASQSTIAHPGQLAWPVASRPTDATAAIQIDGTACDRCGWWLFYGKRRMAGSEEVFDEFWVGLASWTNGTAQQDGLVSGDTIIVTRWFDPKLFGYDTKGGPDSDWLARDDADADEGQIYAMPIVMLGYRSGLDQAHIIMQRMLHTSGTSTGWTTFEQNAPTLDAGDNEPAGMTDPYRRDAERANLGLGVPEGFVQLPAAWDDEIALLDDDTILDVKVAFAPGMSSADVFRALMQPVGWSWHLRGGRYGVWCPAHPLTLADVEVVLDRGVKAAEYGDRGKRRDMGNELRKWAPVDRWVFDYNAKVMDGKPGKRLELNSPDKGLRYRPGGVEEKVSALFHREARFSSRVDLLSRWWSRRHFEVRNYPVPRYIGEQCHFGTVVMITDEELIDVLGEYEVTNRIAIVTRATLDFEDGIKVLDLLVIADRSNTPRLNGPLAQGWGYNTGTARISVKDDWAGFGNGWSDAAAFVEPAYTGITAFGGDAIVECLQWDGSAWAVTLTGTVRSVSTTPGAAYIEITGASGTYRRDQDCWVVLRPSVRSHGAWVESLLAPIADEAGEWTDDVPAQHDYIPWEQ